MLSNSRICFFQGLSWEEKVSNLREELKEKEVDAMIVTALDEVAWLFNLRGNDIPYTPVFRGYAVVDGKKAILYLPPEKHSFDVKEHLRSQVGPCIWKLTTLDQPSVCFYLPGVHDWCG